jgi:WhiB family transcriptional regulator, redox-sensing transcriptional regulator
MSTTTTTPTAGAPTSTRERLMAALDRARAGDVTWGAQAACDGSDIDFYADDVLMETPTADVDMEPALSLCRTCPVQIDCLARALVEQEAFGVWGGATPVERYWLSKQLGLIDGDDGDEHKSGAVVVPLRRTASPVAAAA